VGQRCKNGDNTVANLLFVSLSSSYNVRGEPALACPCPREAETPHPDSKEDGVTWKQRWQAEGGGSELLRLALPLILSNSFWTLQIFIDRMLLNQYSIKASAAAMPAILLFWTPMALLQFTANYATTFVAQYYGAGRPQRIGPAVWQVLYFSLAAGLAFLGLLPLTESLVALGGHSTEVQELEATYFRCLCFVTLPTLVVASVNSFFAGRGDSWTVLLVNAVGLVVNGLLDYVWIFGRWGFPEWGIAGAGWATVVSAYASAAVALTLLFRRRFRDEYHTLSGWRFERELFGRLMRFGLPNGLQWMLDGLAFTAFVFLIGWWGDAELAAANITFSINMVAVLPMLGIGQAVEILVGQRLGQDRPDLAERSTWTGFKLAWLYMSVIAVLYALVPEVFLYFFEPTNESALKDWPAVQRLVPVLLRFVAVYSLFDSMNMTFSFALRGAGDTRFVTAVALALAWPIMVLPTWGAWYFQWGLYWAWGFASAYVIALGFTFLLRFRAGKWKSMRVIEAAPPAEKKIVPDLWTEEEVNEIV
jgi:MATE family multidrug resistance protein